MQKLRENIPYGSFLAAKMACERLAARDPRPFGVGTLDDFEPRGRHVAADKDDDVVVMTIN